jgi:hypothetical protein
VSIQAITENKIFLLWIQRKVKLGQILDYFLMSGSGFQECSKKIENSFINSIKLIKISKGNLIPRYNFDENSQWNPKPWCNAGDSFLFWLVFLLHGELGKYKTG